MAKTEKDTPAPDIELTDEDEVFATFGIEDDNAKRRVREMAAGRALHHRKLNPPKKKKDKDDSDPWGNHSGER